MSRLHELFERGGKAVLCQLKQRRLGPRLDGLPDASYCHSNIKGFLFHGDYLHYGMEKGTPIIPTDFSGR